MWAWTKVEDALPPVNEQVIIFAVGILDGFVGDTVMAMTRMSDKSMFWPHNKVEPHWIEPWQYFFVDYKITHWMPLPEAPKQEI